MQPYSDITEPHRILQPASAVLVVDYPSREVPETLARAGLQVIVRGGPGPTDYAAYEVDHGEVVVRRTGRAPVRVDVVYAHRPVAELTAIIGAARALGAKAVWLQSGVDERGEKQPAGCWMPADDVAAARAAVGGAGLELVWDEWIVDAARRLDHPG